jgi:hypothetical protein
MKNWLAVTAACCVLAGANGFAMAGNPVGSSADDNPGRVKGPKPRLTQTVLEFQTMVGVNGPFLGTLNPIRGINGGGLPWVLDAAKGELKDDGKLEVQVKGLVIPGTSGCGSDCNPAPFFRATVSCLTVNAAGDVVEENISTTNGAEVMIGKPTKGDAKIEAKLNLPDPCLAPIVFVTSPAGAWFAVTGAGTIQ